MEIEEGVIRRGDRPSRITHSEISIILHMIRKPNSIIPYYLSGLSRAHFSPTTFLEIAVYEKIVDPFANLLPDLTAFAHALID